MWRRTPRSVVLPGNTTVVDAVMMRFVVAFRAIACLVVIALLTMLSWLATSRLVRGEALSAHARELVRYRRWAAVGAGSCWVTWCRTPSSLP